MMASERWEWSTTAHQYRDVRTGRFLSRTTTLVLRDNFLERQREAMADLARSVARGDLKIDAWETAMRERITRAWSSEYMYGRGGRGAMTAGDRRALGELIRQQHAYLNGFAQAMERGELSAAQIAARARLYGAATVTAFEIGRAGSYSGLRLPAWPAVGTECRAACRCGWEITEDAVMYRAYWRRHATDSCATCVSRAQSYNPYVQAKTDERMLHVVEAA